MTETITLNAWTGRNGQTRRYVNGWEQLLGLEVDRYNSGNISGAAINGKKISNAEAQRIGSAKIWLDENDEVHVDNWRGRDHKLGFGADHVASLVTDWYQETNR